MAAPHGALDRSGQPGVDPIAREKQSAHRRARGRAGAAVPARAKRWRAARGSRWRATTCASRTRGSASRSSASAVSMSWPLVHRRTSSAPLDTSDRCEADSPKTSRLSNTHCIVRPGSPTNGSSITTRSNQTFTVTIGDAAVARADASMSLSADVSPSKSVAQGKPRDRGRSRPAPTTFGVDLDTRDAGHVDATRGRWHPCGRRRHAAR